MILPSVTLTTRLAVLGEAVAALAVLSGNDS